MFRIINVYSRLTFKLITVCPETLDLLVVSKALHVYFPASKYVMFRTSNPPSWTEYFPPVKTPNYYYYEFRVYVNEKNRLTQLFNVYKIRRSYCRSYISKIYKYIYIGYTKLYLIISSLKKTTENIIEVAKKIGLTFNGNRTKFMIVSRRKHPQNSILIKDISFESTNNFKYLGVDINSQANSHEEIHRWITVGNKCYFSLFQLLRLKIYREIQNLDYIRQS